MAEKRINGSLPTNGNSAIFFSSGDPLFVSCLGTFGGGTFAVQYRNDAGTWATFNAGVVPALTAPGEILVGDFPANLPLRLNMSGATSPSVTFQAQA